MATATAPRYSCSLDCAPYHLSATKATPCKSGDSSPVVERLTQALSVGHPTFISHDYSCCARVVEGFLKTVNNQDGDVENMATRYLCPPSTRLPIASSTRHSTRSPIWLKTDRRQLHHQSLITRKSRGNFRPDNASCYHDSRNYCQRDGQEGRLFDSHQQIRHLHRTQGQRRAKIQFG